jgi:hypothetical protein
MKIVHEDLSALTESNREVYQTIVKRALFIERDRNFLEVHYPLMHPGTKKIMIYTEGARLFLAAENEHTLRKTYICDVPRTLQEQNPFLVIRTS